MTLKQLLRAKKVTQTELAAKLGVRQGTLSRYVIGLRNPDNKMMARIAKALNVSLELRNNGELAFVKGGAA